MTGLEVLKLAAVAARAAAATQPTYPNYERGRQEGFAEGLENAVTLLIEVEAEAARS